ncbi:molecular chaperone GrpE [Friedmanniella luteola]|uniref:Protein GrpE n=1 Tax=Friedmanniella luteola TaxID=546871 RepID=A0A1H1ZUW3_9ACTN|nr:nucleotide exchange factor GrpE [Friedmanniella luteola]SDT37508.1 molecular chaperone GrpE [Friedmanniella luteola]
MSDDQHDGPQGPTVRDRRRIDPETFEVREPQSAAAPAPEAPAAPEPGLPDEQVEQLQTALAERTADLQRLQAEYVNYKRRVDRDRDLTRKVALEGFVKDLLPVLDDVRSAREHGELAGAFKAVGEQVERITTRHGLESFGAKGDPFDPHIHEALMQVPAEGVDGPTCVEILQPGYRIGERVLRPARVAVGEPVEGSAAPVVEQTTDTGAGTPAADAEQ